MSKCTLGNFKTPGYCRPGQDCGRCGFEKAEIERRRELINKGDCWGVDKDGKMRLKIRRTYTDED